MWKNMSKRSPAKQAELKANYARLRDAGYSPNEAARIRSSSPSTINKALSNSPKSFREARPLSEKHSRAATGLGTRYQKKDTYQQAAVEYVPHRGRIKASDYQEIGPGSDRNFENQWAYTMTYVTVDKDGIETRKYFTILPDEKMNKSQLKKFVYDQCNEAGKISRYEARISKSSIELVGAYHNEDYD